MTRNSETLQYKKKLNSHDVNPILPAIA